MKSTILLLSLLFFFTSLFPQQLQTWPEKGIRLETSDDYIVSLSPFSMKINNGSIKIVIETIEGMEGVADLSFSLESYASSFDYLASGKAQSINIDNTIKAVMLPVKKNGQNILLVMFRDTACTKCFVFEATYHNSVKNEVMRILQTLFFSDTNPTPEPVNTPVRVDTAIEPNFTDSGDQSHSTDLAPDFTLENSQGEKISLTDLRGKTVLLDFWGTWCKPCVDGIPHMKELYKTYAGHDFEILGIAFDSNAEKWKKMLSTNGMNWSNVIDPNGNIQQLYDISAYPTLILVGPDGRIIKRGIYADDIPNYLTQKSNPVSHQPIQTNTDLPYQNTELGKKTWSLLSMYAPDGYQILESYYKAPRAMNNFYIGEDSDFTKWIDGNSEMDIIKSLTTVVHEMCHGYTSKLYIKWLIENNRSVDGYSYSAFYHHNGQMTVVQQTDVFESKEIHKIYPKEMITFRYDTYVYPSEPILGTQLEGIYGLLDELNAYYQGAKVAYELDKYYASQANRPDGWLEYFSSFYAVYYSFLEFKSYILTFAIYAQQYYPQQFREITQNTLFMQALKITDDNWQKLIRDFKAKRSELLSSFTQKGYNVFEHDGFLYINGSGIGTFSDRYNVLKNGLNAPQYQRVAAQLGLSSSSGPDM